MSGLEPLAALGLACNILQLIEVGCTTIKLARNIYQSKSPTIDKGLEDNASVLKTISREVQDIRRPASPSSLEKQLIATADKCFIAAQDLQEEVNFLLGNASQKKLAATLKVVAKTTWRRRRLDRLQDSLENAGKLMEKTLLAQIWSRTRAAELDLSAVKHDLRTFIQEYRSGKRDIKHLVSNEGLMTREHISASSKETLEAIGVVHKQMNRLTLESDVQVDQNKRERLLRSLKFPGFNERRNQVSEAYGSTFEWIFLGDDGPVQEDLEESDLEGSDWEDSDMEDLDLGDPSGASWGLFPNWLSSTADVYWISGKPGSGKTTLVKFVLNHPKTTTYLNTWSPQTLIISHFFWRPGTAVQQNIKGLLCSLLFQILEDNVIAANHVLRKLQATKSSTKEEHTDWSTPELRTILLDTLSSYNRPVCIFIDGLDEVDPADGPMEILDLVEQLRRCQNTKLCLSSRPEHILEERLLSYPHLRLQDLTRTNLERYCQDHLKLTPLVHRTNRSTSFEDDGDPIELLVDKAEGVFLWLVLATKSINKGFTHGDTGAMIRQRIDLVPRDLTRLYKDIWDRACEGNPATYRQIAALYFRLMLVHPDLSFQVGLGNRQVWRPTLLHLMLASTPLADQLLDAINSPVDLVPQEKLLEACTAVKRQLKIYCCGLVETCSVHAPSLERGAVGWYGPQYDMLWSTCYLQELRFIHRTAQDFLLDTLDGQEILNHARTSKSSLIYKWIRARLAMNQLYAGNPLYLEDYVHVLNWYPGGVPRSGDPERERAISYLRELSSSGQLLCGYGPWRRLCTATDFLNMAATIYDPELLWKSEISLLSLEKVSEILLNLVFRGISAPYDYFPKTHGHPLIRKLLSGGADPNWRGTTHLSRNLGPWFSTFSQIQTPFTQYLETILNELLRLKGGHYSSIFMDDDAIITMLTDLHMFLSHSADLGDKVYLAANQHDTLMTLGEAKSHWSKSFSVIPLKTSGAQIMDVWLILQFPAHVALKVVLDYLEAETEHSRHGNETGHREISFLSAKRREYLNDRPGSEHCRVIGRLTRTNQERGYSNGNDSPADDEWLWYTPLEGFQVEIVDNLLRCFLRDSILSPHEQRDNIVKSLDHQLQWTLQASGPHNISESLLDLGIWAKVDYEMHDINGWVERFQRRLFADGRSLQN